MKNIEKALVALGAVFGVSACGPAVSTHTCRMTDTNIVVSSRDGERVMFGDIIEAQIDHKGNVIIANAFDLTDPEISLVVRNGKCFAVYRETEVEFGMK